ncbi:chaperonin 10-like protein [Ilyonectria destructans]|nr:chaperonin 10-like protein [Ilyonectria destructans]
MTTPPTKSTALYANEVGEVVLHDLPAPEPQEGEILVKVLYSGVNLSDVRTLKFFGLKNYALGGEFCGYVLETPNLADTPFKAGDIIAGVVLGGIHRATRHATHQEYISIPPSWAYKVPDNVPPQAAAGLGIVVQTATDALFNRLRIPLPPSVALSTESTAAPEGTLVIWGGATGVGMAAIQLARASCVPSIVAIASAKRHDFLKSLGATQCFDYHDESVVDKVKSALKETKGTIWGFDALGSIANPVSQDVLASVIPAHDKVRLATVLLSPHDGFEITLGGRHFDIEFDLPDGRRLFFPKDLEAADRMWRAFGWVLEHYGAEYVPTPARVVEGSGKDAIDELYKMSEMGNFGKVLLKHPLK